jgi:hypothetical protein
MQQFIEKYREQINGALSGFDRLVFRGSLRRLNYGYYEPGLKAMVAKGMEEYLWQNKIPFKDYQDHVKQISERPGMRPQHTGAESHIRTQRQAHHSPHAPQSCALSISDPSRNGLDADQ